jgi:iron complex transport system permease protein
MKRWGPLQLFVTIAICASGWAVIAAGCLCVGSTGWPSRAMLPYRIEPVLIASLAGAALASAGVVYQAILRNPLADPYLLGVSSGASLAAFLWRLPAFLAVGPMLAALGEQGFAFAGAIAAVTIVLLLGTRRGRLEPVTVLLVGVIVNAINGSIFLLINARYPDATAGSGGAFSFLVGGIQSNLTTGQEAAAAICCALGWIVILSITGQLNAAMLGDSEAQALGVRLHRLRWTALGIASIVTAAAVAITGPIGFVGLIAPHTARLLLGTDQRKLLPAATAIGASLLALADAASRLLAADKLFNTLLPVGVLTALLGGPFFLLLLWQQRNASSLSLPGRGPG